MLKLSSSQDFAVKLAHCDAVILNSYRVLGKRPTNTAQANWAQQLHAAMGHRADQREW
jgi:hypothetical protein